MGSCCKFILFFILVLQLSCFSKQSLASVEIDLSEIGAGEAAPVEEVVTLVPPISTEEHSLHDENIDALRKIYRVETEKVIKPRFPKPNYSSYRPYDYKPGGYYPSGYGSTRYKSKYINRNARASIEERYNRILATDAEKIKQYPHLKTQVETVPTKAPTCEPVVKIVYKEVPVPAVAPEPKPKMEAVVLKMPESMRREVEAKRTVKRLPVDVITAPVVNAAPMDDMQDLTAPILSKKDKWIKASLDKDFKPSKKLTRKQQQELIAAAKRVQPVVVPIPKPKPKPVVEEITNPYASQAVKSAGVEATLKRKKPPVKVAKVAKVTKQSVPMDSLEFVDNESILATVVFDPNSSEISDETEATLDQLVSMLNNMPNQRVQIRAYALGDDTTESDARRMSLSRGLKVRTYIKNKGIKPVRLDIRALGSNTDHPPIDRVDVVLIK